MVPLTGISCRSWHVDRDIMAIYRLLAHLVAGVHLLIIFGNFISIPILINVFPFYVWLPIITLLVSPVIGGTFCMFNRLENYFRNLANMPQIHDRIGHIIEKLRGK